MKRAIFIILLIAISFLSIVNAQEQNYVADEKVQSQPCETSFTDKNNFIDGQNSLIYFCVKYINFSSSENFVVNSYLFTQTTTLHDCSDVNGGFNSGHFADINGKAVILCVDRIQGPAQDLLISDTSITPNCASDFYPMNPGIEVSEYTVIQHCVKGGHPPEGDGDKQNSSALMCSSYSGAVEGLPSECIYDVNVDSEPKEKDAILAGILKEGSSSCSAPLKCTCQGTDGLGDSGWTCVFDANYHADACIDGDNSNPSSSNGQIDDSIKTKSNVTNGTMAQEDHCFSGQEVMEYYCLVKDVKSNRVACPEGSSCVDGACLTPEEVACIDSDDSGDDADEIKNGNSIYERGKVTVNISEENITQDSCEGNTLKEAYCTDGEVHTTDIECQNGYTCSETEEGAACIREKEWNVTEHSWANGCPENKFMIGRSNDNSKMKCAYLALEDGTELKWGNQQTLGGWFKQSCNNDEAIVGFVPGRKCAFSIGCFNRMCSLGCTPVNGPISYKTFNQGTSYPGKTICAKIVSEGKSEESIGWSSDSEVSTTSDCTEGPRVMLGIEKDGCASLTLGGASGSENEDEDNDNDQGSTSPTPSNSGGFLGGLFGGGSGGFLSQIISWLNPLNWISKLFGG